MLAAKNKPKFKIGQGTFLPAGARSTRRALGTLHSHVRVPGTQGILISFWFCQCNMQTRTRVRNPWCVACPEHKACLIYFFLTKKYNVTNAARSMVFRAKTAHKKPHANFPRISAPPCPRLASKSTRPAPRASNRHGSPARRRACASSPRRTMRVAKKRPTTSRPS